MVLRVKQFACGTFLLTVLAPLTANAASLYMCRSYGGGSFWSSVHCRTQNALVERIVSVPANLPFEQQVQLGEQARAEGQRLLEAARPNVVVNNAPSPQSECPHISARIEQLDSLARQPQSGAMQGAIADERKRLRDRQFQLHCR